MERLEAKRSKQESANVDGEEDLTSRFNIAKHLGDKDRIVLSQSLARNTLSAVFAKSKQYVRPNVWWGLYNESMFMARYGTVDSSRSQNILSMACDDHLGFGVFTVEQYGSDQQVVKNMDDIYPGVEVTNFDGKYVDFDATKRGKQGYRRTSVGAWHGRDTSTLCSRRTSQNFQLSTTDRCETVDSAEYSDRAA